jgi:TPR repeat protein
MRRRAIVSTLLLASAVYVVRVAAQAAGSQSSPSSKPTISKIRVVVDGRGLNIDISTTSPVVPDSERLLHPDRLVFDFPGFSLLGPAQRIAVNKGPVLAVRASLFQASPPLTRIVIDLKEWANVELQPMENRVLIRIPFDAGGSNQQEESRSRSLPKPDTTPPMPQTQSTLPSSNPQAQPAEGAVQRPTSEYDLLAKAQAVTLAELPALEEKAQTGDAEAETLLALSYHSGVLLKNDEAEALRLLHKAADQGYMAAQESLGIYSAAGIGMETPDPQEALKWYTAAAQKGSVDAATNIGSMYAGGDGVPKDMSAAIRWFRQAADAGGASAAYNLSVIYERGDGVPRDEPQALSWLTKAVDHDFIPALREMGHRAAYPRDRSALPDVQVAIQRFKRAAELGDAISQAILGDIFSNGELVKPDYDQAAKFYRMAAEQGQRDGEFGLAARYIAGEGVPEDPNEALRWFKAAADQGHADAQYDLGAMYELGRGTDADPALAVHYYQLAAQQGVVNAQYRLGVLLAKGKGVAPDRISAYKWFMLAQDSISSAASALSELRHSMSPGEIVEAEHQVDTWRIARKQSHN